MRVVRRPPAEDRNRRVANPRFSRGGEHRSIGFVVGIPKPIVSPTLERPRNVASSPGPVRYSIVAAIVSRGFRFQRHRRRRRRRCRPLT